MKAMPVNPAGKPEPEQAITKTTTPETKIRKAIPVKRGRKN